MSVLSYMLMEDILKSKANFLSPCISGDSSTQPQPWILVWLRMSGILAANTPPWGLGRCDSVISWHLMSAMRSWIPIRILFLRRNTVLCRSSQDWDALGFLKCQRVGLPPLVPYAVGPFTVMACLSVALGCFHDFFCCCCCLRFFLANPLFLFSQDL